VAKHKPKQFWRAHVTAAESSGISKAAYCRQHGLDYKALLRWVGRLRNRGDAAAPTQSLVPVAIREAAPADRATITLRIGPDIALSMPAYTDAVWLGTLLRTVSAC
jgi:transposase-like protein